MIKASQVVPKSKSGANTSGKTVHTVIKEKIKSIKKLRILSEEVYKITLNEIDLLMKKGENSLSEGEVKRLRVLSEAVEEYEDTFEPLEIRSTLPDMIRMKMLQLKLKQQFAAKLLGVSEAKFSLIMNGKQKPDIYFIKALHEKLKLDANQILQVV